MIHASRLSFAAVLFLGLGCFAPTHAQVNPKFVQYTDEIEMVRSMAQLDRRSIIEQGMQLTPEEAGQFWPVYDEYSADQKRTNDQLVKLITDYAAAYESLDDKTAATLRNNLFDLQGDLLSLRKNYAKKFSKVLSQVKVTRFFQLEQKMDAVQNLKLARQIPLVR
jgi:hypothetical protein